MRYVLIALLVVAVLVGIVSVIIDAIMWLIGAAAVAVLALIAYWILRAQWRKVTDDTQA